MSNKTKKLLQWHSAFFAGMQIELAEEADNLIFENEHTLSTKPMQIDVLIIKKNTQRQIQKNIGRIFRKYNIIEYKSPDDYLNIDDFYKVYGYTCFYKSDTGKTNEVKIEDLTITLVCNHYPKELVKHLESIRHTPVKLQSDGIYYIEDKIFPIQLIVTSQLPDDTNIWLKNLTNHLSDKHIAQKLISIYSQHTKEELYKSVMNIIVCANETCFKEEKIMCEALDELYKDKIAEITEARAKALAEILAEAKAEARAEILAEAKAEALAETKAKEHLANQIKKKIAKGKSLAQIADELEEEEETILPLYTQLLNNSN